MIINEIWKRQPRQYQDVSDDNSQPKLGQLRKTRLTLRHLNKLRQMNDLRTYEFAEKMDKIKDQYQPPPAAPTM
jgi:hypothetical protein